MTPRVKLAFALSMIFALVSLAGCKKGPLGCDIIIFPREETVAPGGKVSFTTVNSSGGQVAGRTFSAGLGGGGTIDSDGNYVAPAAPGDYFVFASYTDSGGGNCSAQATVHVVAPASDAGTDAGTDAGATSSVCVPSLQASGVNATTAAVVVNDQFDGGCFQPGSFGVTVAEPALDGGVAVDFNQIIGTPHATISGLSKNKPYVFAAAGVGSDGGFGPLSSYTDPLTLYDPPAPPTDLQVLGTGTDFVLLGFTAPSGQPQPVTIQFLLDTGPGNSFVAWPTVAQSSNAAQLSGLPPAPLFHVEAVSAYANGEQSAVAGPIPFTLHPAPTAATNLSADGGSQVVYLAWTAPADAGSPDASIASYEIDISHDTTSWTAAGTASGAATSGLVSFAQADAGSFSFRVIASNQFGAGPPSNVATGRPLFPAPAVSNSGLVARSGTNQLGLKWKAATDPSGATASSFNLYLNDGGSGAPPDQFVLGVDGGTFSAVIPGLTTGLGYVASIEAQNADGKSGRLNFSKVVLTTWNEPLFPGAQQTQNKGAVALDGGAIVFGGLTGQVFVDPASKQSAYSAFDIDGYPSKWIAGPTLPMELASPASAVAFTDGGSFAYALGGLGSDGGTALTHLFDVPGAQVTAAFADGGYSPWSASATAPAAPARHDMGTASWNEHVYLVGGIDTNLAIADDVQHATAGPGGLSAFSVQSWHMPTARYGAAAVATGGRLYIIGGSQTTSGSVLSDVLVAPILGDGSIGTGAPTLSLPSGRFLAGAAAWNGRIYVTSGAQNANESLAVTEVLIGNIQGDGSIGSWTVNPNPLPQLNGAYIRSPAWIENGYLYVFGWQYYAFARLDPTYGTIGNADGGPQSP